MGLKVVVFDKLDHEMVTNLDGANSKMSIKVKIVRKKVIYHENFDIFFSSQK